MSGNILRANIIAILDNQRVIINAGHEHGVLSGNPFFIYEEGNEIKDPESGEVLGKLENVKAHMEAFVVQEKISVLLPMPIQKLESSTVLSASLAQTYSSAKNQYIDRAELNVRQDQILGVRQPTQIVVGDMVRSVFPFG